MDEIIKYMELLIRAIKKSNEYHLYKQAEDSLSRDPQLKRRVDEFSLSNFKMHTQLEDSQQLFQEIQALDAESIELRKIPQVNAYLQAELDLCKLLQYVSLEILGQMDIHVPDTH